VNEPRRLLAALAALLDDGGRILLVHQTYGRRNWALPGGLVDAGESPQDAAVREVREEVGSTFRPHQVVGVYTLATNGSIRFVFRGTFDGTPRVNDPREIAEIGWFLPDALPEPLAPSAPHAARDVLAGNVGVFRII
jgi:8-oxo-dGTP diphosphatase